MASDGTPITSGDSVDPLIIESRRFYDTVQAPLPQDVPVDYPDPFTGANTTMRKTAPITLDDWKRTFGFPAPGPGEDVQAYRDRVGIAIYYNQNELSVGRELGCARFVDGRDAAGAPIGGIACFVTNYGAGFRQGQAALSAAISGTDVRNTVCITYRPTLGVEYEVQFYVYGASGKRQDWARLDTRGPRPHPQVCMTCHGGDYDSSRHLAKNARFLPLDPNAVLFAVGENVPPGLTRAGQEERIRVVNAMATETPLTPAQRELLSNLYPGAVTTSGATAAGDGIPASWSKNDTDRDFYRGVLRQHCATCHLAGQRGLGDSDLWPYLAFGSPAMFDAGPVDAHVCSDFSMPNAQSTGLTFWEVEGNPGVSVSGQIFPSAADAFLARRGLTRASCKGLAGISGCSWSPNPDALCGGAVNGGATCNLDTDRCVPIVMPPQ